MTICKGCYSFIMKSGLDAMPLFLLDNLLKFIYSEKATKFCEIFPLLLTAVHKVKSKGKIPQNFVAFSEYMNFSSIWFHLFIDYDNVLQSLPYQIYWCLKAQTRLKDWKEPGKLHTYFRVGLPRDFSLGYQKVAFFQIGMKMRYNS